MNDAARIVLIFMLVLGNAIFVAAEYSLVTARRTRLEERAVSGSRSARTAIALMDEPVRFISAVQVGITVFGIALGAVGEPLLSRYFDYLPRGVAFALSFAILTYLSVVLGELVPKAVALQKAESLAMALAVPLEVLARVAHPIIWLLDVSANAVLRIFGMRAAPAGVMTFTREEILQSVAAAEDVGEIGTSEEEMLYKVFDFAGKEAHEVMVPRPEVVGIAADMPVEEALKIVIEQPFTRYPVYRDSLDQITGVLHVRDLFASLHDRGIDETELEGLVRAPHVVPETKDLAALLGDFRREKQHMAVVVDEYGATQGIVTLEDLVEEIVGEIEDEFDLPDESVERVDEQTVRIDGTFPIDDFNETFQTDLRHEDYHTVAGYVFGLLGRAAEPGDEVRTDGLCFRVLVVEGSRIQRLEVEFGLGPDPEAGGGSTELEREAS
jgi:magnesium and cobalt exporter, CNNM family